MLRETQRTYKNITNGKTYKLYSDSATNEIALVNGCGSIASNFILAAHTPIDYKLKNGDIIKLNTGEFYKFDKKNPPVKQKFFMQTKFRDIFTY